MNYRAIIQHAYQLTIRNPILWIFGLFLSSGFNLNVFYAAVVRQSGDTWRLLGESMRGRPLLLGAGGLSFIILFMLANYMKASFISEAHERIHPDGTRCPLCAKREQRETWQQRLPGLITFARVLLASLVTLVATFVILMPLNYLVVLSETNPVPAVISATIIATAIIVCIFALWNTFTVFYIILHRQKFTNAARLAIDLITMRSKVVFEFVVLLIGLYLGTVIIGSFLILVSQWDQATLPGWTSTVLPIVLGSKAVAGLLFGLWFIVTNVFFNLCLLIFFDHLVKPISKEEPLPDALPQSAQ